MRKLKNTLLLCNLLSILFLNAALVQGDKYIYVTKELNLVITKIEIVDSEHKIVPVRNDPLNYGETIIVKIGLLCLDRLESDYIIEINFENQGASGVITASLEIGGNYQIGEYRELLVETRLAPHYWIKSYKSSPLPKFFHDNRYNLFLSLSSKTDKDKKKREVGYIVLKPFISDKKNLVLISGNPDFREFEKLDYVETVTFTPVLPVMQNHSRERNEKRQLFNGVNNNNDPNWELMFWNNNYKNNVFDISLKLNGYHNIYSLVLVYSRTYKSYFLPSFEIILDGYSKKKQFEYNDSRGLHYVFFKDINRTTNEIKLRLNGNNKSQIIVVNEIYIFANKDR